MYAAGKIPGSFFRREGKAQRAGHPHLPAHRPAACARRSPTASATRSTSSAPSSAPTSMNPHDVAAINGASAALMLSGIPFDGPIGAVRLASPPTASGSRTPPTKRVTSRPSRWSSPVGRLDDGDVAIMMVEAGGTEATWELYEDGAPKVDRGRHRRGPRGVEAVDRASRSTSSSSCAKAVQEPAARSSRSRTRSHADYDARRVRRRGRAGRPRARRERHDDRRQDRAQRRARRSLEAGVARLVGRPTSPGRSPSAAEQLKAAFRSLTKEVVRTPHRQRGRAHRRSRPRRHPPAVGRGRRAPHRARLRPVPAGRDPGAQRRHARHAPHGADDRRHRHRRRASATCTTTTSRRSPPARPASCGSPKRREIGHGVLAERALVPVLPDREELPTRSASSPTCCRPTAPPRWLRSAARRCR